MKKISLYFLILGVILVSCQSKKTEETIIEEEQETITPVTVTSLATEPMVEYIELNATSAFLQQGFVKASSNGYVQSVNAQVGKMVSSQQRVFVLKTKEAQSIGNAINALDSTFKFFGIINIKAGTTGYISEINHEPGDYVQEGEQLAVINDVSSFVFILNLPYELRQYVMNKDFVELLLPDGKKMMARISSAMPIVDSASQTQNIILKVSEKNLPINLIGKVRIIKTEKANAVSLPKQSVLSDETQTSFWVMKLIDDSTAAKVPVTKGLEINDRIEILSPRFSASDKFLLTGNYGLADTARIRIVEQ
ncbi:MAG: HlyD family efflux transporter periplasmic adaptor subunit [Bacteroidetes bacterium]|nr:MAG: HlyD family efflux transporter periplasmic adaptor subunit [Bacteroidota bacterium]